MTVCGSVAAAVFVLFLLVLVFVKVGLLLVCGGFGRFGSFIPNRFASCRLCPVALRPVVASGRLYVYRLIAHVCSFRLRVVEWHLFLWLLAFAVPTASHICVLVSLV